MVVNFTRFLDCKRSVSIYNITNSINSFCPHRPICLDDSRQLLLLRKGVTHLTHTCGKGSKAPTLLDSTTQICEFEVRMGIDKASAKNARIELYTLGKIESIVVLLNGNNLVALTRNPNRYEGSGLKPLWSQDIVRGYPS